MLADLEGSLFSQPLFISRHLRVKVPTVQSSDGPDRRCSLAGSSAGIANHDRAEAREAHTILALWVVVYRIR